MTWVLRARRREKSSEGFKAASKGVTSMLSQPPIAADIASVVPRSKLLCAA